MEPMHRTERVSSQTSDEFIERLKGRHELVENVLDTVKQSIASDLVEPWEYPQIEAAIGSFSAAVYGLPVTIESPISHSQFSLAGSRA